ncbi:MAG: terpene cyclase/mutase family protein, partial [Planctomycetes bacterium]|nr:terpene cyclase/mutase family protein [Planctomycetota bacterium]
MFRMFCLILAAVSLATPLVNVRADSGPDRLHRIEPELKRRVDVAQKKALSFLLTAQRPDGGWEGFQGSDPAITALVAKCFAQHPDFGVKHPAVRRAFDYVLTHVREDGGIYVPELGLSNYYTSVVVMALSTSSDPKIKRVVANAQKYLTRIQWDEGENYDRSNVFYGGAGYGRHKRPDLSNTQFMLEALHQSGLPPEHPVFKKAQVFISRCQMLDETNDQPFAKGGDGGFIYSPANGGESKAGEDMVEGRSVLRSYGSMTYAGLKSLLYARVDRDDIRVKRAAGWIRKHYTLSGNPNMPSDRSREGLYYYLHTFARALDAWGEEVIVDASAVRHDWRAD